MKSFIFIILFCFSLSAPAAVYMGGSYGYGNFSSEALSEYKVTPKGLNYGGFVGVGKDFVGLEGFYHSFAATGKVKHDGGNYDINTNASALGAALRFSFQVFYLRLGLARFELDQSLDIEDDSTRQAAEAVYDTQEGAKSGVLYGAGFHTKLGNTFRGFVDFTRYQITGVGYYHTYSLGISFNIPERFIGFGKY